MTMTEPAAAAHGKIKDPAARAADIRHLASQVEISEMMERVRIEALMLLSHIVPDAAQLAAWAHTRLVRCARDDLLNLGFLDPWLPDILTSVVDFLTEQGFEYDSGLWTPVK